MLVKPSKGLLVLDLNFPKIHILSQIIAWIRSYAGFLVIFSAAIIGFFYWRYYFDQNLILAYNDSMSHLDIARRVVEGIKPGFAQIGSVWLPLPHILMIPFIWNDFLWHTGLAGSFVSILSFTGSSYLIFQLTKLVTKDTWAGVIAYLIFALNPNMAYMQAVPMTESLLIFLSLFSVYYLLRWQQGGRFTDLIICAFATMLSTLTRYDGWMMLLQLVLIIVIISFRQGRAGRVESNLILFGTMAFYGICLWLLWNLLIFGDPLYFATGPFSARAQQTVFELENRLPSKGNILYSIVIYSLAVLKNNGALLTLIAVFGALYYFLKNKIESQALVVTLFFSPLFFNVAALFFGHSIINLEELPPNVLFNVRYGLMMLPAIAFFVGTLSARKKSLQLLFLLILAVQTIFMYKEQDIITVADGKKGSSAQNTNLTGLWLSQNAKDGLILIAASSQDSLIFQSGFPMKRFVTEGTGKIWDESLDDPTKHVEFIAMHHGDLVYERLFNNGNFLTAYEKVYDGEFTDIFKRKTAGNKRPLTVDDLP